MLHCSELVQGPHWFVAELQTGALARQSPLLQQCCGLQPPSGIEPHSWFAQTLPFAHCELVVHGPHCPCGR